MSELRKTKLKRAASYCAALVVLGSASLLAGLLTARRTLPALGNLDGSAAPATTPEISTVRTAAAAETNTAHLQQSPVQQQVERLLEQAIQEDESSITALREKADSWRGRLRNTDRLFDLVLAALHSSDLRVRTVAIEVDLAANNLSKTRASVERLLRAVQSDPASEGMALWRLGELANRGVEPAKVLSSLLSLLRSRSEHTRYWAVEGLAMLGNDATIDPLLDTMAHDSSSRVRELAASSLAKAGMLTREERMAAVPHLLNFADDDSLTAAARELVYGALRVITGAELGNDPGAWREWWAKHDPAREAPRQRISVVRT